MPDDATRTNLRHDLPDAHTNTQRHNIPTSANSKGGVNLGRYRILAVLGEGGMGTVYRAEQKNPHRIVALKVIRFGVTSTEHLRRFEQEAETLGRLQHPGIAQIYEAGTADSGSGPQPYFAMELIEGRPLIDYAQQHTLNSRASLELMARICDAVNHAHQRGIIHRDLKPNNILVDQSGQPKILDFGVARVTDSDAQATRQTDMGQLIGTLAYMSPEQVLGDPLELDIRSDVYALGVILYELLAGKPPYNTERKSLLEVVQVVRGEDPARLSSIDRRYRGDIETIVAKALEKDKSRRYASAAELAADVRRYLTDEPIVARPPSTSYQLQKFARRNKALVVGTAAVFLVLAAGAVVSTWQAVRARRAEARAKQESAVSRAVNQFLQDDLLSQANPESQGGTDSAPDPEVKARTLLDRAASQVEKRFADQPLVESAVQKTIGGAYFGLGLYAEAERHLRRAYDLSSARRGADDPETLDILMMVSGAAYNQDKHKEAIAAAKLILDSETRTRGAKDAKTIEAMQNLGALYLGTAQYAEAEPLLDKALEFQSRQNGYDNINTLNTSDSLVQMYIEQSRYAEARPLLTKGLESYRRMFGPEHPFTQREMFGLGKVLLGEGNYPEAEKLLSNVLAVERRVKGAQHPDTYYAANNLSQVYVEEGKLSQGISLLENTLQNSRQNLGPNAPHTVRTEATLGWAYDSQGDLPRAEAMWRLALEGFRSLGEDQGAFDMRELLGQNLTRQGKFDKAEPLLRQALAFREKGDPHDWQRFRAQAFLGAALAGLRRYSEAEPLLLSGYQGMKDSTRMPAKQKKWVRSSGEDVVDLYAQWAKPVQAAQWRQKIQKP